MKVVVARDEVEMGRMAARRVAAVIATRPDAVLGLATGRTPTGLYRELVRLHREEGVDFGAVTTFNLDELVGLGEEHPQSFRRSMREQLFDPVGVPEAHVHFPPCTPGDAKACEDYEKRIRRHGGIDLQVLGIGTDGHIAFNEPGDGFSSRTRFKKLAPETLAYVSRDSGPAGEAPACVVTMGVATILEAKAILLLASGVAKAAAVAAAIEGPVSTRCPASALQRHPDVTFLLDPEAASRLRTRPSPRARP